MPFSLNPLSKQGLQKDLDPKKSLEVSTVYPTIADLQAATAPSISGYTAKITSNPDIPVLKYDASSTRNDAFAVKPAAISSGSPGRWVYPTTRLDPAWAGAPQTGTSTLLSSRFGSLGAAQAVYPNATALTQEIDTVCLADALSLATGGVIISGNLILDAPIQVSGKKNFLFLGTTPNAKITIKANNTFCTVAGTKYAICFQDAKNVLVLGLTIDGNNAALNTLRGVATKNVYYNLLFTSNVPAYTAGSVFYNFQSNDIVVEKCTFLNPFSGGLGFRLVDGVTVQNSVFDGGLFLHQTMATRCHNVEIFNNKYIGNAALRANVITLCLVSPGDYTGDQYDLDAGANACGFFTASVAISATAPTGSLDFTVTMGAASAYTTGAKPYYLQSGPNWAGQVIYVSPRLPANSTINEEEIYVFSEDVAAGTVILRRKGYTGTDYNWSGEQVWVETANEAFYCKNIRVDSNLFTQGYAGVFLLCCNYWSITNNNGSLCDDYILDAEICINGLLANNNVVGDPTLISGGRIGLLGNMRNVTVTGNNFDGCVLELIAAQLVAVFSIKNIRITGNTLAQFTGNTLSNPCCVQNLNIKGNTFSELSTRKRSTGLRTLFSTIFVGVPNSGGYFFNVEIIDNIFNSSAQQPISTKAVQGIIIKGNKVLAPARYRALVFDLAQNDANFANVNCTTGIIGDNYIYKGSTDIGFLLLSQDGTPTANFIRLEPNNYIWNSALNRYSLYMSDSKLWNIALGTITSGATNTNPYPYPIEVSVPITFNPTGGAAATAQINLLNVAGTTLTQWAFDSQPAGTTVGAVRTLRFKVPGDGRWVLTVANATIGTALAYASL